MASTPFGKPIEVRCPGCGEPTLYTQLNPYRPFCSARCKGLDLGAWSQESYRVEAPPSTENLDDASS